MKLATHNSMSYLPPKKWWMYPFKFMAKCQNKTLGEQLNLGVTLFDIRIKYNKNNEPEFAHGLISYQHKDIMKTFKMLNLYSKKNEKITIRLLLEIQKEDSNQEELFIKDCRLLKAMCPNLIFCCGRRKYDWKQIYDFNNPEPSIDQKVSSMQGTILDDWWPWLYAKLHNKQSIKEGTNKDFLMLDFI